MELDLDHPSLDKVRHWTRNAVIVSVILHIFFSVLTVFIVAIRMHHKPQADFISQERIRPRLEPRKLEMKVKVQDLQKRSARPRLQQRMVSLSPADIALPEIKKVEKVRKKVKRDFSTLGVSGFGSGIGGGLGDGMGGGLGIGSLPAALSGRCDPIDRSRRMRQNGGKQSSEDAVLNALRWLQGTQNSDGSWGTEFKAAMTGLALLAYLGHCETPDSAEFGPTVKKAIDYLIDLGEDGAMMSTGGGHSSAYEHGICTYALSEAYIMTRMYGLKKVVQKAIERIINGQSQVGGWVYGYASQDSDTSVVGWQLQALKAYKLTGLKAKGFDQCIERAMANLKGSQESNGSFRYRRSKPGGGYNLTGAGTFGMQIFGLDNSSEVRKGIEFILNGPEVKYEAGNAHIYAWYYHTQACFTKGGSSWSKWNRMFQSQISQAQSSDGSWPVEGGGKSEKRAKGDAVIYRTCLCTLMLEVYYRYLSV